MSAKSLAAAPRRRRSRRRDRQPHPRGDHRSSEGPAVAITTIPVAIEGAEIVVNATPGESALERLGGLRDALAGKLLVDVSNAYT